jgi:hypothetical protein
MYVNVFWIQLRNIYTRHLLSSSKDSRVSDILGLIESSVCDLSSVPYRRFTSLGDSMCMNLKLVKITRLSSVGERPSPSVLACS